MVIDSVLENHVLSQKPFLFGTQLMNLTDEMHVAIVDRGGLMGVPHLVYKIGDDEKP